MKIQPDADNPPEDSNEVQEFRKNSIILPITISGIFWVIVIVLGIFLTLMILFVSLAFWVVTKNPFFIVSAAFGGMLFVVWGYINLKDKDRLNKTEN